MKIIFHFLAPTLLALIAAQSSIANAQAALSFPDPDPSAHPIVSEPPPAAYISPTETMKLHNYFFDAFGPYPLTLSALIAGYHQARHNPPDWREGFPGYAERYGSDFGTSAVSISARYLAAEALHEDTLFYRCACKGVWPRLQHAVVSTFIARRGDDGHKVFALPIVVGPYAGPFAAVHSWYPARYGAKDAFRMGNYGLLDFALGNISLEFLPSLSPSKANSWITRLHLDNRHAAREGESAP